MPAGARLCAEHQPQRVARTRATAKFHDLGLVCLCGWSATRVRLKVGEDAPECTADFQVCCVAGLPACGPPQGQQSWIFPRPADLEIGDTADWEVCGTILRPHPLLITPISTGLGHPLIEPHLHPVRPQPLRQLHSYG